jgi:membrane associated rhomboid family serine protease
MNSYDSSGPRRPSSFRIGPGLTVTPVVRVLLLINVAVYVLERLAGWELTPAFALIPGTIWPWRVYTLISYMFLHGGFLHILFNMFMLWMFGTAIENAWGSRPFLRYYLVCGVGGGLTQALVSWGSLTPIVGASAAVMGLLLAYAIMYPNQRVYLYGIIGIRMKYMVAGLVLLDLVQGVGRTDSAVAHFAHLGGMIFGFIYLKFDPQTNAMARRWRATRAHWRMDQNARQMQNQAAQTRTVDEILEKIQDHGIDSLTDKEKEILRAASRH